VLRGKAEEGKAEGVKGSERWGGSELEPGIAGRDLFAYKPLSTVVKYR